MKETGEIANFPPFTFDLHTGELRNKGRVTKLHPQPAQLLALLVSRAGELVTREEIQEALWKEETFVDFDLGINSCIRQIRAALGDDADHPRYVQTIPRRGYRFIKTAEPESELPVEVIQHSNRRRLLSVALPAVAIAVGVWSFLRSPKPAPPVTRFVVSLPPGEELGGPFPSLALSPDGNYLAYAAGPAGDATTLYLRALDAFEARAIPDTENAHTPFFSPDGHWLGFVVAGKLKKVAVGGGPSLTICDLPREGVGASWGPHGTIVFAAMQTSGLYQVSADGGTPEILTSPDRKNGEGGHAWPHVPPSGNVVLFTVHSRDRSRIGTVSLETGKIGTLLKGSSDARHFSEGHLIHAQSGTLLAVPFDPSRIAATGPSISILDGVYSRHRFGMDLPYFAVSRTGVLAYVPRGEALPESTLLWVDREGQVQPIGNGTMSYRWPQLSPDGRRVAVAGIMDGAFDIWVYDFDRRTWNRIATEGTNVVPVWAPDGERIVFASNQSGVMNVYRTRADGSGEAKPLVVGERPQFPLSWTPDGRTLLFAERSLATGWDIGTVRDGGGVAQPLLSGAFDEHEGRISPDGHWLAYASNESGRFEVYVRPFPDIEGGKWPISSEGGRAPVWSRDGRELFYRRGRLMMAVAVTADPIFTVSKPRTLSEGRYERVPSGGQNYDVSLDGERFLMVQSPPDAVPTQINIVVNWFDELAREKESP